MVCFILAYFVGAAERELQKPQSSITPTGPEAQKESSWENGTKSFASKL